MIPISPLFAIFGIGQTELIIVCIVVLILFGHRLPSVMFSLGKGIKDFKKGINTQDDDEGQTPAVASDKKD
ncbi:MAG TPA: twin-arginine translocase TatA/TatE family subunit [Pirellulaceae bacterium]|nr:twin-arginine translocase TatA/TatE family subunit [Pirellulaceae bacterium]